MIEKKKLKRIVERLERLKDYQPTGVFAVMFARSRSIDSIHAERAAIVERFDRRTFRNLQHLEHFWKHRAQARLDKHLYLLQIYSVYRSELEATRQRRDRTLGDPGRFWCWCCDLSAAHQWHHIIPISKGGIADPINVVPLCVPCHRDVHASLEKRK